MAADDVFAQDRTKGRTMLAQDHKKQDINKIFNADLDQKEKDTLSSFFSKKETDPQGIMYDNANNASLRMADANIKWANPEVLSKLTQKERQVAEETGLPLNPFYALSPDEQKTLLRIQSLPPGNKDKKDLTSMNIDWLSNYWDKQSEYNDQMKEQGYRTDNPYFESGRIQASPELQKKLDFYNTLPKGTGARSNYLKANPDVLEFFTKSANLTNMKRIALGLPPTDNSGGSSGFFPYKKKSPEQTLLEELFKSRKSSISKSLKRSNNLTKRVKKSGYESIEALLKKKKSSVGDKPKLKTKIKS